MYTNHSPLSVGNGPSVDRIQSQTFCAIGGGGGKRGGTTAVKSVDEEGVHKGRGWVASDEEWGNWTTTGSRMGGRGWEERQKVRSDLTLHTHTARSV